MRTAHADAPPKIHQGSQAGTARMAPAVDESTATVKDRLTVQPRGHADGTLRSTPAGPEAARSEVLRVRREDVRRVVL